MQYVSGPHVMPNADEVSQDLSIKTLVYPEILIYIYTTQINSTCIIYNCWSMYSAFELWKRCFINWTLLLLLLWLEYLWLMIQLTLCDVTPIQVQIMLVKAGASPCESLQYDHKLLPRWAKIHFKYSYTLSWK